jgi:hypothetical protein
MPISKISTLFLNAIQILSFGRIEATLEVSEYQTF